MISSSASTGVGEEEEVVDRLALVADLVGKPAATPRLVAVPGATRALDRVANALDDLVRPLFSELGVQQKHDFVVVQTRILLPTVLVGPVSWAPLRDDGATDGARSGGSVASAA